MLFSLYFIDFDNLLLHLLQLILTHALMKAVSQMTFKHLIFKSRDSALYCTGLSDDINTVFVLLYHLLYPVDLASNAIQTANDCFVVFMYSVHELIVYP